MPQPIYARRPSQRVPHFRMADLHRGGSDVITTIFVSNLHCSSCVNSIQDALSSLSPKPSAVDTSVVTQTVTVKHSPELSPSVIKDAIDQAGFDIVSTPSLSTDAPKSPSLSLHSIARIPAILTGKDKKHLEQCTLCQLEQKARLENGAGPSSARRETFGEDTLIEGSPVKAIEVDRHSEYSAEKRTLTGSPISQPMPMTGTQRVTLSVGGMTCASCSNAVTNTLCELSGTSSVVVNLLGNSATLNVDSEDIVPTIIEAVEEIGYEAEVVSVEPLNKPAPTPRRSAPRAIDDGQWKLTLSVGGMTCAACSNTVMGILNGIDGVSDVVVSLLGASATLLIVRKELASQVVEAIEDGGYEAEIISEEPVNSLNEKDKVSEVARTVSLQVDGMFCAHCPGKVMDTLSSSFGDKITVLKPLTTHTDPILRISYVPSSPTFTLRHIIHAIASAPSPGSPFAAHIYHPPSLEDRARHMQRREQRHLLERLVFSVVVAIPTFIISIVYMDLLPADNATRVWFESPMWAGNVARAVWAMFFLATPVMFYSAGTFHRRSLKEVWALWRPGSRTPVWRRFVRFGSMNMLVSTGVSVAYFASIALLALSAGRPPAGTGAGDTTTYFDSVVFLAMFLLIGRFLEAYSKGRTADAITALGKLRPTTALLVLSVTEQSLATIPSGTTVSPDDLELGDSEKEQADLSMKPGFKIDKVDVELLEAGDIVRVQHGASPPADGTVVAGDGGAFDESSLTGEAKLVKKQVGDQVFLGTINRAGVVDVRVDAIGGETMLDHVVKVVREGQTRRAPIERVADMITGYFVPVITLLAVITWVIWLGLGLGGALPDSYLDIDVGGWVVWSLEFAISVFVVACPCGIGLAAPTALLVGSGLAAKHGILARGGGEAFQEAARLDLIVFDKTGTLTEGGEPRVTDAEIIQGERLNPKLTREVVLGIAAEIESASSHPLAIAIGKYCSDNAAKAQSGSSFEEIAGRGLRTQFAGLGCSAIIGNELWMAENGCAVDGRVSGKLDVWKAQGKSVILLAVRDEQSEKGPKFAIAAIFAVADPLRPEAQGVVAQLQEQGIATWMISGDNEITAKAVAKMVGIPETNVIAGVLPHQKAEKIQWLQQVGAKRRQKSFFSRQKENERCVVAMVGDGINDAPALTAADVGIAIGSGSDVAISSAAFILMNANLHSLLTLTDLSRKVFNRVKFNFFWASCYNVVAVPVAAGVIYPAGNARLSPVWASLAMAISSVSVVCSSLLLRLYKPPSVGER